MASPKTVRMVNPTDPRASADAYDAHKDGGIIVPVEEIDLMKSHGFLLEPVEEKGQRAKEVAERKERRDAALARRQAEEDALRGV